MPYFKDITTTSWLDPLPYTRRGMLAQLQNLRPLPSVNMPNTNVDAGNSPAPCPRPAASDSFVSPLGKVQCLQVVQPPGALLDNEQQKARSVFGNISNINDADNSPPAPRRPDKACSIVIPPTGNTQLPPPAVDVLTPKMQEIFQLYMGGEDSSAHGENEMVTAHQEFIRVADAAGDLLNDTLLALQSPKDPATAISQEELHRQQEAASWRTNHKKRKVNNGGDIF